MARYDFRNLGDVFQQGVYEVPEYQRNYAWKKEEQVKDLWEDLQNIDLSKTSRHYTGTIVVEKLVDKSKFGKTFGQFKIIDGQQRLATLSVLLFCVYEKLEKIQSQEASKTAENVLNDYIKDKSTEQHKLKLNGSDDSFFKDVILKTKEKEMVGKEPVTHSEKRLYDAKDFFREKLPQDFDFLNALIEKITNRLLFIQYELGNEVEAGLVFEVMNDRGKPLTQVDKIKNYLIYISYKKDDKDLAKNINEVWGEIFRNLMGIDIFDEESLIRYHWIIYKKQYDSQILADVHRAIKEEYSLKNEEVLSEIRDYIESLKECSYVFKELNNPEISFNDWHSNLENIRKYLCGLHRFKNVAPFMPLLIASRIVFKYQPEKFEEILRLCEVFAFRVYKVGNQRANFKQSMFYRLAYDLFEKRNSSDVDILGNYEEIITEIRNAIKERGRNEDVENYLRRESLYYGWLENYEVKYLLYELESNKCVKEAPSPWQKIEEETSIEHIWPDKPRGIENWSEEQKQIHAACRYKLGNLTLTYWNSELSNKDFSDKKEKYKESNLIIQRELANNNSWDKDKIDYRTEEIISFALERWEI